MVRFSGTVPEDYFFEVESARGAHKDVRCVQGVGDYGPNQFSGMSYLECRPRGVQFVSFSPEELTVTLRWDGGELTNRVVPEYRIFYPNGKACPPECRVGDVDLVAAE